VLVKLTPNITDIRYAARAAKAGGGDGVSLINTINSITGVDLDTFAPRPTVAGLSSHGGYCGPAVKPIALHMVAEISRDPETAGLPISGIGGIATWRDAAEFILLGATSVQVCTAVMHYGFRIVEDLIDGLSGYLDSKGMASVNELRGQSVEKIRDWKELNLNYVIRASVDQDKCIGCGLCYAACNDGAHQAISAEREEGRTKVEIIEDACVGCNLCSLVCPVRDCIVMKQIPTDYDAVSWEDYNAGRGKLAPRPQEGH
jgi:dihydropyrimidine dehydrogenase (NAD+) subunit PreA